MSYKKALEILRNHEPKALAKGRLSTICAGDMRYCFAGAIAKHLGVDVFGLEDQYSLPSAIAVRVWSEYNLTSEELDEIVDANDEFEGTDEARHAHVVARLEAEVARESAS